MASTITSDRALAAASSWSRGTPRRHSTSPAPLVASSARGRRAPADPAPVARSSLRWRPPGRQGRTHRRRQERQRRRPDGLDHGDQPHPAPGRRRQSSEDPHGPASPCAEALEGSEEAAGSPGPSLDHEAAHHAAAHAARAEPAEETASATPHHDRVRPLAPRLSQDGHHGRSVDDAHMGARPHDAAAPPGRAPPPAGGRR
jgi:hypothetical protein